MSLGIQISWRGLLTFASTPKNEVGALTRGRFFGIGLDKLITYRMIIAIEIMRMYNSGSAMRVDVNCLASRERLSAESKVIAADAFYLAAGKNEKKKKCNQPLGTCSSQTTAASMTLVAVTR